MTVLFIGKENEDKMESHLFKNFKDGEEHEVQIKAVVLVPGKIIVGICFPDISTENQFPHVTLMTNRCPPKTSNDVLYSGCHDK